MLRPGRHKLIGFAQRSQGLMVAPGNPLGIEGLPALARQGVRFVNRQLGTGTRVVLNELMEAHRVPAVDVDGFERTEPSHQAVAEAVASGRADAAFGIETAARAKGLTFLPLAQESYFLVTLQSNLAHPHVATLLALLGTPTWVHTIDGIPGYCAQHSGEVLSLRKVLPWWNYRKAKR
jgi:putative molybdopterin biosynthesis protein